MKILKLVSKHNVFTFIVTVIFISFILNSCVKKNIVVWQTKPVLKVPESVFYDIIRNRIYVSNINGKPDAKDGNGFISLLDKNGHIVKLKWVTGLNGPKGMALYGNKLYVSDINKVAEIDVNSGNIIHFFNAPGAIFLNDITVDKKGNVFITDSGKGAVFKLNTRGNIKLWLYKKILKGANGLAMENNNLLVGAIGHLLKINTKTKNISIIFKTKGMIDGLIPLGNNKYIISNWNGKIQLIEKGKKPTVLQNTTKEKINAADIGFIPKKKIILVPTFFNNRVVAIKFL